MELPLLNYYRVAILFQSPLTHTYPCSLTGVIGGKLIIAGGRQFYTYLSSAEQYDPSTGSWTDLTSMGTGRSDAAAGDAA